MSRYDDYRSSTGNLAGGGGGATRWDSERYVREREIERERERYRAAPPPVMERPPPWEERETFVERRGPLRDERYHHEERYGPPARRPQQRYYDEPDDMSVGGALIPIPRREEAPPPARPARPGLLRRQSSLDTFDRRPTRRFDRFEDYEEDREWYRGAPPPHTRPREVIPVPVPSRRRTPPRYEEDYEDIRVAEPDYYGDEEFRKYREREWTTSRRRRDSHSRSHSSEHRRRRSPPREREVEIVKEVIEKEVIEEKPFPRRGKTRMPKRLVHTRAVLELGYPYEEEGETIIILKALGKENIDEVVSLSKEYRERDVVTEVRTVHLIEGTPAVHEERIVEKIITAPMSEAPRSVREWDVLKSETRSPSPARTRRSHSRRDSRSRHGSPRREEVYKEIHEIREVSPARTARTAHTAHTTRSRRRSSPPRMELVERREIYEDDHGESASVHAGPLALVLPDRRKNEHDIQAEIRALEAERKALKLERQLERHRRVDRAVIIEKERPEVVEVRKDRKAPDPRLIRAMMATLT